MTTLKKGKILTRIPKGLQWIERKRSQTEKNYEAEEKQSQPIQNQQVEQNKPVPQPEMHLKPEPVKAHQMPQQPHVQHQQMHTAPAPQPIETQPAPMPQPMNAPQSSIQAQQPEPVHSAAQQYDEHEEEILENIDDENEKEIQTQPAKRARDKKESLEEKSSEKGLAKGWTRATFIIKQDHLETLKAIAYWDRVPLKDVLDEAIDYFFDNKELKEYLRHKRKK